MKNPDFDAIAMRLLCERAEDRLERVEAARLVIERYARLPQDAVQTMVRLQQERHPD